MTQYPKLVIPSLTVYNIQFFTYPTICNMYIYINCGHTVMELRPDMFPLQYRQDVNIYIIIHYLMVCNKTTGYTHTQDLASQGRKVQEICTEILF